MWRSERIAVCLFHFWPFDGAFGYLAGDSDLFPAPPLARLLFWPRWLRASMLRHWVAAMMVIVKLFASGSMSTATKSTPAFCSVSRNRVSRDRRSSLAINSVAFNALSAGERFV